MEIIILPTAQGCWEDQMRFKKNVKHFPNLEVPYKYAWLLAIIQFVSTFPHWSQFDPWGNKQTHQLNILTCEDLFTSYMSMNWLSLWALSCLIGKSATSSSNQRLMWKNPEAEVVISQSRPPMRIEAVTRMVLPSWRLLIKTIFNCSDKLELPQTISNCIFFFVMAWPHRNS